MAFLDFHQHFRCWWPALKKVHDGDELVCHSAVVWIYLLALVLRPSHHWFLLTDFPLSPPNLIFYSLLSWCNKSIKSGEVVGWNKITINVEYLLWFTRYSLLEGSSRVRAASNTTPSTRCEKFLMLEDN
jgi:hypothetical protein